MQVDAEIGVDEEEVARTAAARSRRCRSPRSRPAARAAWRAAESSSGWRRRIHTRAGPSAHGSSSQRISIALAAKLRRSGSSSAKRTGVPACGPGMAASGIPSPARGGPLSGGVVAAESSRAEWSRAAAPREPLGRAARRRGRSAARRRAARRRAPARGVRRGRSAWRSSAGRTAPDAAARSSAERCAARSPRLEPLEGRGDQRRRRAAVQRAVVPRVPRACSVGRKRSPSARKMLSLIARSVGEAVDEIGEQSRVAQRRAMPEARQPGPQRRQAPGRDRGCGRGRE